MIVLSFKHRFLCVVVVEDLIVVISVVVGIPGRELGRYIRRC